MGAFGQTFSRIAGAVKNVFYPTRFVEAAGANSDDDPSWRRLSDDPVRDLLPLEQDRMQRIAAYLWDTNLIANRIIELQCAYLLAEGVKLRVIDDEEMSKVLTRFWKDPINQMDIKLPRKVRELALFGEQCWPAFVNEVDGAVRLGYIDPLQISQVVLDPDNKEQPIGVITKRDDKGRYLKYKVIINGPESVFTARTQAIRESFSDGECFYFTVNDLAGSRRGRSDLRASADWLDVYEQWMWGDVQRIDFMRAFVWDVTLSGADEAAVKKRAGEIAANPPRPGSTRVHNESEKWAAVSPSLQGTDTTHAARLLRNHILGGSSIPEHWIGGGGDVNRAVGAEMTEPTMKILSMRQIVWRHILQSVGCFCIRQKILAETGVEPEWDDPHLAVEAAFPEMSPKDTTKYAAALQQVVAAVVMAVTNGKLDDETAVKIIAAVASRLGVEIDPDKVLENAKAAADKKAEQDTFQTPPVASSASDTPDDSSGGTPESVPQGDTSELDAIAA